MSNPFPLATRYRLDDENCWLVGVDPLRRYWLSVNGDETLNVAIPGLCCEHFAAFREAILSFREMRSGSTMKLPTAIGVPLTVECVSGNCFLIQSEVNGAPVSHIFDHEALESLLMTAHPDWICAPHHKELGRQMISLSWSQPAAVEVA